MIDLTASDPSRALLRPARRLPRVKKHPAKFPLSILEAMGPHLEPGWRVLDPFAGTGLMANIPDIDAYCLEIEEDWATDVCGDAFHPPFRPHSFDAIATSVCYGNRFADHHEPKDGSRRRSYTFDIGHDLHSNNAGKLQWGPAYWDWHRRVLPPLLDLLTYESHASFVLNISDHWRGKALMPVTEWWVGIICMRGMYLDTAIKVETQRLKDGENSELRATHESVLVFKWNH